MLMALGIVATSAFYGLATLVAVFLVFASIFGDPLGHWPFFAFLIFTALGCWGAGRVVHHVIVGPTIRPIRRSPSGRRWVRATRPPAAVRMPSPPIRRSAESLLAQLPGADGTAERSFRQIVVDRDHRTGPSFQNSAVQDWRARKDSNFQPPDS